MLASYQLYRGWTIEMPLIPSRAKGTSLLQKWILHQGKSRSLRKAQGFMTDDRSSVIRIDMPDIIEVTGTIGIETDILPVLIHQVFETREIHDR
jgi:hypothetical protein